MSTKNSSITEEQLSRNLRIERIYCVLYNMHFSKNGRHFECCGHFGSYINFCKTETILMSNKTIVYNFIGLLLEIAWCRCFIKTFLNQIATILELAVIVTLKRKIRWKNKWHYWVHIDKSFPQCYLLLTKV